MHWSYNDVYSSHFIQIIVMCGAFTDIHYSEQYYSCSAFAYVIYSVNVTINIKYDSSIFGNWETVTAKLSNTILNVITDIKDVTI